jgi:hypothetical protein
MALSLALSQPTNKQNLVANLAQSGYRKILQIGFIITGQLFPRYC